MGKVKLGIVVLLLCVIDRITKVIFYQEVGVANDLIIYKEFLIIFSMLLLVLLRNHFNVDAKNKYFYLFYIGGVSNLFDLINYGRVIDFIPILNYFANMSDIYITVGLLFTIHEIIYGNRKHKINS
jgi:lipoprotein signal peptidase